MEISLPETSLYLAFLLTTYRTPALLTRRFENQEIPEQRLRVHQAPDDLAGFFGLYDRKERDDQSQHIVTCIGSSMVKL